MAAGKFIAFEGIDGSGKDTQLALLSAALSERGAAFKTIAFPRHGHPAGFFVDKYLQPDHPYGTPKEVGPWRASFFYALDRYDASFEIRSWLAAGYLVVADRYLTSNIGHQGGKIADDREREKYVNWLYDLEYRICGIPRPDLHILFLLPADIAMARIERKKPRLYLGNSKKDAHEADRKHLEGALEAYRWIARREPERFRVVECVEAGRELTPEEVHAAVLAILEPFLAGENGAKV